MSETPQDVQLAIGRLFRMLTGQPSASDVSDYFACREIIMGAAAERGMNTAGPYEPNYARDRLRGAAGAA